MSNVCARCEAVLDDSVVRCPRCGASVEARANVQRKSRFQLGESIDGRYTVVDILPSGGMGEVYKVRHIHLNDLRIIKVLRPELTHDETGKKRFMREAKIAASISHPNLAGLHDFSALSDGSFYMVGEYVDGMTVAEHLNGGGKFEIAHVLAVAEQVLRALGALHHKGVVHRDISPDNLMLTKNPAGTTMIKVIDLGIAKSIDAPEGLTSAGFFIGKARYASPEQIRCDSDEKIDSRTDLYSLGVVLYEMVTGRDPYAGSTPAEYVIRKVTQEVKKINEPGKPRLVPDEIERFILTLLKANRDERFQTADQALTEIKRLQTNFPELADQTLSTVTQTRPMPSDALPEPAPRKRPITEEVDLRTFEKPAEPSAAMAPPHEEAIPTMSMPHPPPESPQSTEVIPMAEFARELYAQQHGGATGQGAAAVPPAPASSQLFGDDASTVVDYMPPDSQEPFTEVPTLENFAPPEGVFPQSTDVIPMIDSATANALRGQDGSKESPFPPLNPEATVVTPLPIMERGASPKRTEDLDMKQDPSLAPTDVGAQIPFDPSINPNSRVSRRNPPLVPMPAGGPPPVPSVPIPPPIAPPRPPVAASPSRPVTPPPQPVRPVTPPPARVVPAPPPPAPVAAPQKLPATPTSGKKSNTILWVVVIGLLLAMIAAGAVAYKMLAARLLKPADNNTTAVATAAPQEARADTAPTVVVPPPVPTTSSIPTESIPVVQTDTSSTSTTTATTDTVTQTVAPIATESVEPAKVIPPEPKKKPPAKKKRERVAVAKVPTETAAPQPEVPKVREGDIVESGEGVVDAQIRDKAPLKLSFRARLGRARGSVKIYALVGIGGKVEQVRILSSSGNDQIDRAAEIAGTASTFTPATKNGIRVREWRTIEYQVGK